MAKLSKELTIGNLHPRETVFVEGILGALNSEVVIAADGATSLALDLRGTFSMTVEVSGSIDGVNYTLIPVRPINVAALVYVAAVAGTASGIWVGTAGTFRFIRARVTAYTSGSAAVTLVADTAPLDDTLQGRVAPLIVTATGATGAAVTLTMPAPGAGLRQYITNLLINRTATALLTAGAAPTVVTTTNIPGALAFTFGADASPQGTDKTIREYFAYPLCVTAQNTATTIVCPLTTGVIWRVSAGYYVAP